MNPKYNVAHLEYVDIYHSSYKNKPSQLLQYIMSNECSDYRVIATITEHKLRNRK